MRVRQLRLFADTLLCPHACHLSFTNARFNRHAFPRVSNVGRSLCEVIVVKRQTSSSSSSSSRSSRLSSMLVRIDRVASSSPSSSSSWWLSPSWSRLCLLIARARRPNLRGSVAPEKRDMSVSRVSGSRRAQWQRFRQHTHRWRQRNRDMMESIRKWFYRPKVSTSRTLLLAFFSSPILSSSSPSRSVCRVLFFSLSFSLFVSLSLSLVRFNVFAFRSSLFFF